VTNHVKFLINLKQRSIIVLLISLFLFTLSVDYVQAQPFAYVTNRGPGDVSVIDITTNTVVDTVVVGAHPMGISITPNGDFAYTSNFNDNNVSVIDIALDSVTVTIDVGTAPFGIAITPDGAFAYVTNISSNNVSVIDITTNTVVATVSVGTQPRGLAITPDGSFAYVANRLSNNVSVIDIATNIVVATFAVGSEPWDVAITPGGEFAYIANDGSKDISVIATATDTVIATVTIGFNLGSIAITPDGAFVYATNWNGNNLSVIATSTNTVTDTIIVGTGSEDVAFTPDGTLAYVVNAVSETVSVIAIATNTVVSTISVGTGPSAIAISPGSNPVESSIVANLDDSGLGSLRAAIDSANTLAGPHVITFDSSLSGGTIQPLSALPILTDDSTTINGDIDGDGTPDIEIDGTNAGDVVGIEIRGSFNTLNGLVINSFYTSGVRILASNNNSIVGNYIGTDSSGTAAMPNRTSGLHIASNSSDNLIQNNVISGNSGTGLHISGSSGNIVEGNFIGTDITGTQTLSNSLGISISLGSSGNMIGGTTVDERNIISGNNADGVRLDDADSNKVFGNYIGTDLSGTAVLGNGGIGGNGVFIFSNSHYNTIGGAAAGEGNLISGNSGNGVQLSGGPHDNLIENDFIGTDFSGTIDLGNAKGITLQDAWQNTIKNNLISGNILFGIQMITAQNHSNVVIGNFIGTDITGTQTLSNLWGISITLGASGNTIGGTTVDERNIISGNNFNGVRLTDADSNKVFGNYIGTDLSGTAVLGNGYNGVFIENNSHHNTIGGAAAGEGNLISGNSRDGVNIDDADRNKIIGNYIGTNSSGAATIGNVGNGVFIHNSSQHNAIGGFSGNQKNVIAYNGNDGVKVENDLTLFNTISRNSIYNNDSLGIQLTNGGNSGIGAPTFVDASDNRVVGTAPSNFTVEVFADSTDEGKYFLGSVMADDLGTWVFDWVFPQDLNINATATDPNGNTSEFAFLTDSIPPGPSPIIGDIPDVTFLEDSTHTTLDLNDHAMDADNNLAELSWSVSGNDSVVVLIDSVTHEVVFSAPANWNGQEVLTFTVTDPDSNSDSDDVTVVVVPVNDPPSIVGLLQPTAGTVVSPDSIQFVWTPSEDPDLNDSTRYNLYYTLDPDFVTFSAVTGLGDTMYTELAGLIADEVYFWRVGAVDIEELETFSSIDSFSTVTVGVDDELAGIPEEFNLYQNYPNPFNPTTVIKYALPSQSNVSLVIYNLKGQEIMRWDESNITPGYYEKTWEGTTQAGIPVSSGMYIYRIIAGEFVLTRKMVLLK